MEITTRAATPADSEFARLVHHRAYRDVVMRQYGSWNEDAQVEFFAASWSASVHEIILCDGRPCGYTCVEERDVDIQANELVIDPEFQAQGLGTYILREVIGRARVLGLPVRLRTHLVNRAVNLYQRLGFREYARTETHVLMEWRDPGL